MPSAFSSASTCVSPVISTSYITGQIIGVNGGMYI
jgi:hypothetical protein